MRNEGWGMNHEGASNHGPLVRWFAGEKGKRILFLLLLRRLCGLIISQERGMRNGVERRGRVNNYWRSRKRFMAIVSESISSSDKTAILLFKRLLSALMIWYLLKLGQNRRCTTRGLPSRVPYRQPWPCMRQYHFRFHLVQPWLSSGSNYSMKRINGQ